MEFPEMMDIDFSADIFGGLFPEQYGGILPGPDHLQANAEPNRPRIPRQYAVDAPHPAWDGQAIDPWFLDLQNHPILPGRPMLAHPSIEAPAIRPRTPRQHAVDLSGQAGDGLAINPFFPGVADHPMLPALPVLQHPDVDVPAIRPRTRNPDYNQPIEFTRTQTPQTMEQALQEARQANKKGEKIMVPNRPDFKKGHMTPEQKVDYAAYRKIYKLAIQQRDREVVRLPEEEQEAATLAWNKEVNLEDSKPKKTRKAKKTEQAEE